MDLKKILKTIKLQENNISMILGGIILIVLVIFVINYFRNLKNQPQITTATNTQSTVHKVIKGDTLWSIAKKHYDKGSDWKKIADANNITDPLKIEIDQELTVPDATHHEDTPQATSTPVATPLVTSVPTAAPEATTQPTNTNIDNPIAGANYTVVKGDNLWKIAIRAYGDGYKWVQIAHENKLKDPNIIHAGNTFILPR